MNKPLTDTFIYQNMNKGNFITNNIAKILKNGTYLTAKDLDESFVTINRYKYPLKLKVLEDLNDGIIKIVLPPEGVKMPTYMPFFLTKVKSSVVAVVDFSVYGTKTSTGYNIDPKKLYCMLEAAHLALLYYHYEKTISQNSTIIMKGSAIYSNMFVRVLNKKYSLNLSKDKLQKVLFLASKFFLVNILGLKDSNTVFNYAIKNCGGDESHISIIDTNEVFEIENYNNFATFIQALAKTDELRLGLDDLTVRGFLEAYILMFDSSAVLALESFPYFVYNVVAMANGAYINNQKLLEQIAGSDADKFYGELIVLDR